MRFAFADDQEELRRSTRRVLEAHVSLARVREAAMQGASYDAALWRRLAVDLGLAGLVIPEEHGGAGLGWVELVGVMEELGRSLASVPFLSTVGLATSAILVAADAGQQRVLLPPIARGEQTATLAYAEADGAGATARIDGDHVVLTGRKRFVVDGDTADLLIVATGAPEPDAAPGAIALFAVPARTPGVERQRVPTMDLTRALADVTLDGVRVPASARLGGAGSDGRAALDRALALARIALAAEQLGGAQRCLDMAVDYARVRTQFGRPIGSFQAIQHACADMFVLVESARSAAYYGGWAAAHEADADDDLATTAAIAKAYCSDAFYRCAGDNIQVHGGIGFTWEHDAHLYFKRARASRDLLGTPAEQRERLAQVIGLVNQERG